jgi:MFS family permease
MLAVMLGFGVLSRLIFGWVLNRIGGLPTLLLGSTVQAIALALYLPFDGLVSLYVISATFGMAQGGLVPSYAVIIRELFPAREAGLRVSLAISTTLAGMALGGWLAGAIYDRTGSYAAALINGIAWNIVNMAIVFWLLQQMRGRAERAHPRTQHVAGAPGVDRAQHDRHPTSTKAKPNKRLPRTRRTAPGRSAGHRSWSCWFFLVHSYFNAKAIPETIRARLTSLRNCTSLSFWNICRPR